MNPAKIVSQSYGKANVRLTKVTRHAERHDLAELSVDITLGGDFAATYLTGDNSRVVATDSMKNTVYVLASRHPLDAIEPFAQDLARHFLAQYEQVTDAAVVITQHLWQRILVNGKPDPHSFVGGPSESPGCEVFVNRHGTATHGMLNDLLVFKTSESSFCDFVRDEYTTLSDMHDRLIATSVSARWKYISENVAWDSCHQRVRSALLETFAGHKKSLSVQQTLYVMGQAALDACPEIDSLQLVMPNKHRIPFNLAPFGLENRNEIFVATDEPYGNIRATLERG